MKTKIAVGDTVRYSPRWLRSIGSSDDELRRARGVVTKLTRYGETTIAGVEWSTSRMPSSACVQYLQRAPSEETRT